MIDCFPKLSSHEKEKAQNLEDSIENVNIKSLRRIKNNSSSNLKRKSPCRIKSIMTRYRKISKGNADNLSKGNVKSLLKINDST